MVKTLLKNIKLFFTKNKLLALLFSLGLFVSFLSALYGSASIRSLQLSQVEYSDPTTTYTLTASESTPFSSISEHIEVISQTYSDELKRFRLNLQEDIQYYVVGEGFKADYGPGFSKQDKPQILIGTGLTGTSIELGDDYTYNHKEYQVVGLVELFYKHTINKLESTDNVHVETIELFFHAPLKQSTKEAIELYMMSYLSTFEIGLPQSQSISDRLNIGFNTLVSVLILAVGLLNVIGLYRYVVLKRNSDLAIFRIVGCTKRQAMSIMLLELSFYTTLQYIISVVVYHNLLDQLFYKSSPLYYLNALGLVDYVIIYLILMTLMIVIGIMTLFSHINQEPVSILKLVRR